jgi:flagellar hook assembly protein FlgD
MLGVVAVNSFGDVTVSLQQLSPYNSANHYGTALRRGAENVPILEISFGRPAGAVLQELKLRYTGTRLADVGPYARLYNSSDVLVSERSISSGTVTFPLSETLPGTYVVKLDVLAGAGSNRVTLGFDSALIDGVPINVNDTTHTNPTAFAYIDASAPAPDKYEPVTVTVNSVDYTITGYDGVYDRRAKILKLRFYDEKDPIGPTTPKVQNPLVRLVWSDGDGDTPVPQVDLSKITLRALDDNQPINLSGATLLWPGTGGLYVPSGTAIPAAGAEFPKGASAFSSEVWIRLTSSQDAHVNNNIIPDNSTGIVAQGGVELAQAIELYINGALWDAGANVDTKPADGDFKNAIGEHVKSIIAIGDTTPPALKETGNIYEHVWDETTKTNQGKLTLTFDEVVDVSTIDDLEKIKLAAGTADIPLIGADVLTDIDAKVVEIKITDEETVGKVATVQREYTTLYVRLEAGAVKDLVGNPNAEQRWQAIEKWIGDTRKPEFKVGESYYIHDDGSDNHYAKLVLKFNEQMDTRGGFINAANIELAAQQTGDNPAPIYLTQSEIALNQKFSDEIVFHLTALHRDTISKWGPPIIWIRLIVDAVSDRAGNGVATMAMRQALGPLLLTSPTHPSEEKWYASPDVSFTWQPIVEGVIGYYVILDKEQATIPTPETAQDYVIGTEKNYRNLTDGTWYFHIRGEFPEGSLTVVACYCVNIDSTPKVSSSSHPDQQKWYQSREVKINWKIQDIPSAKAFYYILDDKPDTSPDKSKATKTNDTSLFTMLPSDGEWYFHLVWEDEVGSLSKTTHYKLAVDATPSEPVTQLSVLLTDEGNINLSWVEPKDNASGVANYQIFRSIFSGAVGVSVGTDITKIEFIDKTVEKGQVYYYTVMPVDKAGNKQMNGNVQLSTENAPTEGTLSVQPSFGHVGDEIEVSGMSFEANEQVKVKLNDIEITVKAGEDGSFKATLKVPTLTGGKHVLVAEGRIRKVEGWFEVKGRVSEITPNKAPVGSIITVVGDGFAANAKVSVKIGGETTSIVNGKETTTDGKLSVDVVVPKVGLGIQTLTVSDGQGEVASSIQVIEGEPMTGGRGKFIMELAKGLNMVSLPLKPDFEMDAKTFGELLDATVVIQLNRETKQFVPFIPTVDMTNFPIEGGKGYIVNVLESKAVEVEGKAWFSAPNRDDSGREPVWAFAVGGEVGFGERVVVRNARSGEAASGEVRGGRFGVVLGGMQGREVVGEGDVVEVLVYDGGKLVGRGEVRVSIEQLERAVGLVHVERLPERTKLLPNYPNPFNPETWIPFALAENAEVVIRMYDLKGRLVRELDLGRLEAGSYVSKGKAGYWDGRNEQGEMVASGVYIYQMVADKKTFTRRMGVLK